MLANQIALATLAAMLGSEASRAKRPWNYVLWMLAILVLIVALGLQLLNVWVPRLGALVTSIFGSPVAWFVLFIGLFLVLRPFWAKPKVPSQAERLRHLYAEADRIVHRIRNIREVKWLRQETGDEVIELVRDGQSLLLSFAKSGLPIPQFRTHSAERALIGQHEYFSTLCPLIRDGHVENVEAIAEEIAGRAEQLSISFDLENWLVRRL